MATKAQPHQLLWEARQLARANNMFVVDKEDKGVPVRILYRALPPPARPERLGKSRSPASFLRLVRRCAAKSE